jgi:hypothetical protein
MPGGSGGLDLSAVIQAALVGLVLLAAALAAVRRAASRYFVVDAAGFAAAYDDHLHPTEYAMPPQEGNRQLPQPAVARQGTCAQCGGASSKICTGCKRARYWCVLCLLRPPPLSFPCCCCCCCFAILHCCRVPAESCRFFRVIRWLLRAILP